MKLLLASKLILMAVLVAGMQQAALLAHEAPATTEPLVEGGAAAVTSLAIPEPSTAMLIGAIGLMLMLRRRRLHA